MHIKPLVMQKIFSIFHNSINETVLCGNYELYIDKYRNNYKYNKVNKQYRRFFINNYIEIIIVWPFSFNDRG